MMWDLYDITNYVTLDNRIRLEYYENNLKSKHGLKIEPKLFPNAESYYCFKINESFLRASSN